MEPRVAPQYDTQLVATLEPLQGHPLAVHLHAVHPQGRRATRHRFAMTPRLYLKGGHWCPATMVDSTNYDAEARRNPFFAQVWTEEANA